MSIRRIILFSLLAIAFVAMVGIPKASQFYAQNNNEEEVLVAGRNVNMVLGDELPDGDPWLQRQNEPSIAASTSNPLHLLAAANDYRTVDLPITQGALPGIPEGTAQSQGDAWLGIFKSFDGGESWISTLLPGYPQSLDETSPLYGYSAAADPIVRAGTDGLFYVCGIVFQRDPVTKEIGESAVFVARYRDNNNKEKGDTIEYLGAEIVFQGNSGQFFDKPWMAVDIPRSGSCGNVYVVASDFVGNKNQRAHGKVYVSKSTDCGETWGHHVQLTNAGSPHQGSAIAIDPQDGTVYVALRRFKEEKNKNKTIPDAILVTRSDDYGKKFGKLVEVDEIDPFDQPTSPLMFRTSCYPTMTVDDNGIVYIAWSEREWGPNNEGRIVISTSSNRGKNWSDPMPVESPAMNPENPAELLQGHQFMPSLTYANGKLMLAWYDSRYDKAGDECLFEDYIADDPGCEWRHTIDVRVARANPGSIPVFEQSIQVSRYIWVILEEDGEWVLRQSQWNPPNFPLFQGGTTPFHGDYIDITPSPMFIWDELLSKWRFNTEPTDSPVFHVAWTDNRDVKPPLAYPWDWTDYTPTTYSNPDFDSEGKPVCGSEWRPGMRNQNVYTSRISQGLEVGSTGNSKPLNILRAFVIEVNNTTDEEKSFRMSIGTPAPEGQASFLQFGLDPILELDVTIAANSSISRPVFFQSSDPNASVRIDVIEISEPGGNSVPGGLTGFIILNPGDQDAVIEDPDGWVGAPVEYEEAYDAAIGPAQVFDWSQDLPVNYIELNPNMFSPNMFSPNMFSPNMFSTVVVSPNMFSPNMFSPNMFSPNMFSPNMFSPNMFSPNMFSPNMFSAAPPEGVNFENARVVDVLWKVTNAGSATSSYTFKTFAKEALPEGIYVQLIVFKTTHMPVTNGLDCELMGAPQDELLANIINPNMFSPNMFSPNMFSTNIFNAAIENATFSVPPGDEVSVVLRLLEENPAQAKFLQTGELFDLKTFADGIGGGATPQEVNTKDAEAGIRIPRAAATYLVIGTAALSDGTVGVEYTEYVDAIGGDGNYSWTLNSGELPDGLSITTTQTPPYPYSRGMILGTPATAGTFYFVIQVDDTSGQTDTQFYKITIHTGAVPDSPTITTPSPLPNAVQGNYYGVALDASGGQLPYIWTLAPESSLPDYLTLDEGGVISGRPESVGTHAFTVQVTDQDRDSDTKQFSLEILESAQAEVTISGMVYDENYNLLNGVVLRGLPNTPVTGSGDWPDGYYEDTVPYGWEGTVIPFKVGHSFDPTQRVYTSTDTAADIPDQDYNLPLGATISGTLTYNGVSPLVPNQVPSGDNHEVFFFGTEGDPPQEWNFTANYNNQDGTFTIEDVPPGDYSLSVHIDPDAPYNLDHWPGAFRGDLDFSVQAGQTAVQVNLPCQIYMHLTSPHDNSASAGPMPPPYPTWTSPIIFQWDSVDGASDYTYRVNKIYDDGTPSETIYNVTADQTQVSLPLDPSGDHDFYVFHVLAKNSSYEQLGRLGIEWDNGRTSSYYFRVSPPQVQVINLTFEVQPSNTVAGQNISPAVQVKAQDENDTPLPGISITLGIDPSANPGNGTLSGGTASLTGPDGIATFSNLSIDRGGFGYALIASANPSVTSDSFNIEGFSYTDSMAAGRSNHCATRLADGRVLITGGRGLSAPLNSAEIYDPASGDFSSTGNMNVAREDHTATLLPDGTVLIAGGATGNLTSEIYAPAPDPANGTFSYTTGSPNRWRKNHTATYIPSIHKVLITGGESSGGITDSAELYDPVLQTFEYTDSMDYLRFLHTATLLNNGTVLIAGGRVDWNVPTEKSEIYDPATGVFSLTGNMNEERSLHTATKLFNGKVLIAGGDYLDDDSLTVHKSAELYDPDFGTFTYTSEDMDFYHANHPATILENGNVLICAGAWGGITAEIYNVATDSFDQTGNMEVTREYHTLTLLPDGTALAVAGRYFIQGQRAVRDTAEIWYPLTILPTHTISGTINLGDATGPGISDVLMTGFPQFPVKTDAFGNYAGTVPDGWSGTITPTKVGYTFSPPSYPYSNVIADQHQRDYVGSVVVPGYTVSGTVYYSVNGLDGVDVDLGQGSTSSPPLQSTTTANGGQYSFSGVVNGTYWVKAHGPSSEYIGWKAVSPVVVADQNATQNIDLPKKMTLLTPANGSDVTDTIPTLTWQANPEATKYTVQLNLTNPWTLIEHVHDIQTTSYTVQTTLTVGENYTWQIDAYDGFNHHVGTTQTAFTFNVIALPVPTKVELTGPSRVGGGFISEALTLTAQDDIGIPIPVTQNTVFGLSSDSSGISTFYSDPEGTDPITQVTIPTGQTSVTFYYMDHLPGTPSVTATWASGGSDLGSDDHQTAVWAVVGQIAFTSDRDGNEEIYIMNADGSGQTRLTDNSEYDRSPRWSSDGSKIVFHSTRDGNTEIYVMNADGSYQTNLTNHSSADSRPDWSPDGSKIVFSSSRVGNDNTELYVMNSDGTDQTRLTYNEADSIQASWSPDGNKIAFCSDNDGDNEIYVINSDGSGQTQLTDDPATDSLPEWSPDGTKIAFYSNRSGNGDIFVMNADGSDQTNLTNILGSDSMPSWSPDGSKIVFMSDRVGNRQLYVMNADGSDQTRLTNNSDDDTYASWGGAKIAFSSNWAINIMNLDGQGQTKISTVGGTCRRPAWSPDGDKIAFGRGYSGTWDIYVINTDGTGITQLTATDTASDSQPSWSPDGGMIAFCSDRDGNQEIYIMNSDGTMPTRLTDHSEFDGEPCWSPYGSKIAFRSHRDGNAEIYVMNADGTEPTRLTDNLAGDQTPCWSPDGMFIAFSSNVDGNFEIYKMNADGTNLTRLTDNTASDSEPYWSPDGRKIIFQSNRDGNNELYIMNADGTGVTRITINSLSDEHPSWRPKARIILSYEFVTKWGSFGTGDGQFDFPTGIAVNSAGDVYVVDMNNNRVQKFDSNGNYLDQWGTSGTGDGQFDLPLGIAVDSAGDVYVVDERNNRVQKFDSDGNYLDQWGTSGNGDGQFSNPIGIAIDGSDNVYVTDAWNNRVQRFDSNGNYLDQWGTSGNGDGQFDFPTGIAVDSAGDVYVVDHENNRIQKFDSDGTFIIKWGSFGTGDGQFDHPGFIAADNSGYVYVGEEKNNRVQKFTSSGTFVTKWGSYGSGDGQFDHPAGIAVDSSGYVYVVEHSNHRVQKFQRKN